MSRPIRWLHLSDLHLGARGEEAWWLVHSELEAEIRGLVRELGTPDLILFTGDLAFCGAHQQYEQVDSFLARLRSWMGDEAAGADPLLLAVPGNHDLARPKRGWRYGVLDRFAEADDDHVREIERELWDERDTSSIADLFTAYEEWRERSMTPAAGERCSIFHASHFPGDFAVVVEPDGAFPLAIVGLNSAWQQYSAGDFEHRLVIPERQFLAALPAGGGQNPLELLRDRRALLLLHHPPSWLAPRGLEVFRRSIYSPDHFDACLFGHLHASRTETVAVSGGRPRCYVQAPSLFGLEHYGDSQEERRFGFSWGEISADGRIRLWPRRHVVRGDGSGAFVRDESYGEADEDGGTTVSMPPQPGAPPPEPEPDVAAWLRDLEGRTDHIKIAGIVTHARGALRPPIEELYTPLRSRAPIVRSEAEPAAAAPEDVEAQLGGRLGERDLALPDLLPHHPRLLLVGQPGAGKTTFLSLVACMLARDGLGEPAPGGGTWRELHLGLDPGNPPPVPVLLKIADLAGIMRAPDAPAHLNDTRRWLLHLLERTCEDNELAIPTDHWQRLLADGEALLLLDGLDEVDDERLRDRIFDVFRDACRHWSCPIVVASRPLATAELEEIGFAATTVEPFGEREIELFVDRWVEVLHRAEAEPPDDRAGAEGAGATPTRPLSGPEADYRRALARAILDRPRVKRLATNPVMLTCLAVVHWNEGRLPEGRSRVYRAVIGWLLKAREALRREAGYDNLFAEQAFARLALAMMGNGEGKRPVFDLEEAVVAIDPVVARRYPRLEREGRRHQARRWLRFECRVSGIVEELPRSRLRFWHLTFQEYLAARELAWRSDGEEDPEADWWPLVRDHLEDAQWRETVELFPGCLLDGGGPRRVDRLLERVDALCREATPEALTRWLALPVSSAACSSPSRSSTITPRGRSPAPTKAAWRRRCRSSSPRAPASSPSTTASPPPRLSAAPATPGSPPATTTSSRCPAPAA